MTNEIIEGIINQDNRVLKTFYDSNFPVMRKWAAQYGLSTDDAQDIYQDAFVGLYVNVRKGRYVAREGAKISTYFLQICKNKIKDFKKSAHHQRVVSIDTYTDKREDPDDVLSAISSAERMEFIHQIFGQLGEVCQRILKSFYWEKLTLAEIASKEDLTADSAKNKKYRCMNELKGLFVNKKKQLDEY